MSFFGIHDIITSDARTNWELPEMIEERIRKRKRIGHLKVSLVSGAISLCVAVVSYASGTFGSDIAVRAVCVYVLTGFFTPLFLLSVNDILWHSKSFRKTNLLLLAALEVLLLVVIVLIVSSVSMGIVMRDFLIIKDNAKYSVLFGLVIALVFATGGTMRAFLGRRFLRNLLSGIYNRAKEERRIIVFIDLADSTHLAERFPPSQFFEILNDFLALIEMYCYFYGGEIYKYMGDGAIAVWKDTAGDFENVHTLLHEVAAEMDQKNETVFQDKYRCRLGYTAGVHYGKVLTGGLGDEKKEIGYWGDTINTTSRIQGVCKRFHVKELLSKEFVSELKHKQQKTSAEPKFCEFADIHLRGKEGVHTLYAVHKPLVQESHCGGDQ